MEDTIDKTSQLAVNSDSVERLKRKRATLRQTTTKLINKIEVVLNQSLTDTYTKDLKINELYDLKNQLNEKNNLLKGLDAQIENCIDLDDLEQEINQSQEYQERIIKWLGRIERNVNKYSDIKIIRSVSPIATSDTSNVNNSMNRIDRFNDNIVKLPKLAICKFYGDCSKWLDFWNQFEIAIHSNDSLSKVEKFSYLKTYLAGNALTAISGFSLTNENYDSSIELLKERFGRSDLIISSHVNKLLSIEPVKNSSNIKALRKLYDECEVQIRSLQSLNVAAGSYGNLLCPIVLQRLPEELNLEYNRKRESNSEFNIVELISFLRKEVECREASYLILNNKSSVKNFEFENQKSFNSNKYVPTKKNFATAAALTTSLKEGCIFCKSKIHIAENCPLSIDDRKQFVKSQGLCFRCLRRRHIAKQCWRRDLCKKCKRPHSHLLCERADVTTNESKIESENTETTVSTLNCSKGEDTNPILLQTSNAILKGKTKQKLVRILYDSGSQRCFVRREVAKALALKVIRKESVRIYGFGGESSTSFSVYDVVHLDLQNRTNPTLKITIEALVIQKITSAQVAVPTKWVRQAAFEKGFELSDKGKLTDIDILLGADYLGEILYDKPLRLSKRLIATNSLFGFVIQGRAFNESASSLICVGHVATEQELISEQLRSLWNLEAIGISGENENKQIDKDIMASFERNTVYKNNRYETKLLWKEDQEKLNSNFEVAKRRLFGLKNKLINNSKLFEEYENVFREQLSEGIIEECKFEDKELGYYSPHHAVIREEKSTTKLRIVYDASSKAKDELSLNDCLDPGLNLLPDLLKVILNFRKFKYGFVADIQKAFLQIGISTDDRDFLRFLWFKNFKEPCYKECDFKVFRFARVPFGVSCSPFLLSATIRLHLKKYGDTKSEACQMLQNLYVDDLIFGADTIEKASCLSFDAREILSEANMNLRKWASNSDDLRNIWLENGIECQQSSDVNDIPLKVLGLIWNSKEDTLKIDLSNVLDIICNLEPTKRTVLSICGKVFDPIGLITPFMIRMKFLLQSLWEKGVAWDVALPDNLQSLWKEWCIELNNLNGLVVRRPYFDYFKTNAVQVHIFSDSSTKAYGAVAYFRIRSDKEYDTSFILSKSRLAPLKRMTLPRLELMGALIAARIANYLMSVFTFLRPTDIFLWTDSQICLHWIKGSAREWKQFVSNRVLEIQQKTDPQNWNYCKGKENPADKLTRGVKASSLLSDNVWWAGPAWLRKSEIHELQTFDFNCDSDDINKERRTVSEIIQMPCEITSANESLLDLNKYSSLSKVIRITAWTKRFIAKARKNPVQNDSLTAEELDVAEKFWIQKEQRQHFSSEIKALQSSKPISQNSNIFSLSPFLDQNQILRIRGRLNESDYTLEEKHPILLPRGSRFAELVVLHEHNKALHAGVAATLTRLRHKYWIPKGRQLVRKVINRCLVCRKYAAKPAKQRTGQLPRDRISETPPFTVTGVDFTGPVYVKLGKDTLKSYIVLFTCAVTRAIHLELVSDMTTRKFILALRRFISRRGNCRVFYSDNAKTFKCASKDLQYFWNIIKERDLQNFISSEGVTWKFIVELAPWWGGFYERLMRSIKEPLKKILGRAQLTFEEFMTVLTEVENVVNQRPLTYVYNDATEPEALSPAHFLLIGRKVEYPCNFAELLNTSSARDCLIKRKLYQARLLGQIWSKWKNQYLLDLKNFHFFGTPDVKKELQVDDVVLLEGTSKSKFLWDLGRITQVMKGRDGLVRSCVIKTKKGEYKRPVQLLFPLELSD